MIAVLRAAADEDHGVRQAHSVLHVGCIGIEYPARQARQFPLNAEHIGELAFTHGLLLHELTPRSASLEEAYMRLTQNAVEYRSEPTTADRPTAENGQHR